MKYSKIVKGLFLCRKNRFVAEILIDHKIETVHVKNTGRCRELLVPDATVFLADVFKENRKTRYDLVAVVKEMENGDSILINMDSQIPNDVISEWLPKSDLFSDKAMVRREVFFGKSRFDFYVEDLNRKAFLEVKGVTLEEKGIAFFPDAPTQRGIKHLEELSKAVQEGYEAYVVFVIQMKGVSEFRPNVKTHPQFAEALREAKDAGVKVLAYDSIVKENSIVLSDPIPVIL